MAKLFNQYYTKKFELPGMFTAMNGAIQYFELTTKVALTAAEPEDPENPTVEEVKAIAEAQANYLRVLEVLRANGAQPVITHVDDKTLGFTLEQTWVYGERAPIQVSAHYEDGKADEDSKYAGLVDGVEKDLKVAFENVHALEAKGDKIEEIYVEDAEGMLVDTESDFVKVKVTAGSLNANKVDLA